MTGARVAVVGGGITGLAAAYELSRSRGAPRVVVLEAGDRLGGKITTTSFAGVPVDCGPDAVLARVPWAEQLMGELGLGPEIVAPATGGASVYARGRLRPLPDGLVRGVPSHVGPLLRSGILSPTGIARAGLDLVAPRRDHGADPTIAQVIGGRFGLDTLAYRETALPHPLNGGGFVVPRSQGWLMTAGTFVSTKWPARHPPGQIILRCSAGRHGDDRPAALTDDDLVDRLHRELEQALGVTEGPVAGRPVGPLVSPVRGRPPRPGRPHRRHTGGGRARRGRHRRVDARRGRRRLHPPGPLRRPPGLARRLT